MQEKIIQIPFNSKFFLASHKAIWSFSVRKSFVRNIGFTLLAFFLLAINLMFERQDDPVGSMLVGGYLIYMIMYWIGLFERRVKHFSKLKKKAIHFEKESMESTYIFSDNGFECTDKEKSFKLVWSLFKPITVYKNNILLSLKDGGVIFAIGKAELGDIDYDVLCEILKSKIG